MSGLQAAAAVAAGGAIGSLLRWRVGLWLNPLGPQGLPLGTLAVNCVGGLLVGALAWRLTQVPHDSLRLLLVTGLLGGLTTFSTFSAESLTLLQGGRWGWALAHVAAHVLGALACAALGTALARSVWGGVTP